MMVEQASLPALLNGGGDDAAGAGAVCYQYRHGGSKSTMIVRNRDEVETVTYGGDAEGVEMRPLITEREGAPRFAMRIFKLDADGHTPYHAHESEHEVYILEGTGTVRGNDGERSLRAGDSVFLAPYEEHQFRAGAAGLQFICCVPHH
jgi:quercetin dioxygenase-like cupin family protein